MCCTLKGNDLSFCIVLHNFLLSRYIVQLELPLCFLKMLQDITMSSLYRQYPRLLFLPTVMAPRISMDLFSTKQLEFTPDVLVVDIEHFQSKLILHFPYKFTQ